jgi:ATP-dependent Clp protease ATP-binding subunit ClpC
MNQLTRRADQIIRLAKEIAHQDGQGFVGTEHLLLAIMREGTGLGAQVLRYKGVTEEQVREVIVEVVRDRLHETWVLGRQPGTPNCKDVLSRAAEEARGMGNWQVCSVHLLLALMAEKDSTGAKALKALGVTTESVRKCLVRQLAVG